MPLTLEEHFDPKTGFLDSPHQTGFTVFKKLAFIQYLIKHNASIYRAAEAIGVDHVTVLAHMRRDKPFADKIQEAKSWHAHRVEGVLMEQALDPKKTLDRIVFLRAYMPDKYARTEVSSPNVSITIDMGAFSKELESAKNKLKAIDAEFMENADTKSVTVDGFPSGTSDKLDYVKSPTGQDFPPTPS